MSIDQICKSMATYYASQGAAYDALFSNYCEENGLEDDTLDEEFDVDPSDCYLIDFDENFPYNRDKVDDLAKFIYNLLRKCQENPGISFFGGYELQRKVADQQNSAQQLDLISVNYESELFQENNANKNDEKPILRLINTQKEWKIQETNILKMKKIANTRITNILNDYVFPTLNLNNKYKNDIITYFTKNEIITVEQISKMKKTEFTKKIMDYCNNPSLEQPLNKLYSTIAQYAEYTELESKLISSSETKSCCKINCTDSIFNKPIRTQIINRSIFSNSILLEFSQNHSKQESKMDEKMELLCELNTTFSRRNRFENINNRQILEISSTSKTIVCADNMFQDGDILCKINDMTLDKLETVDVIKLIEYQPLPFTLTFKRSKIKLCKCSNKKQTTTNNPCTEMKKWFIKWLIHFIKLTLGVTSKVSSILDAVTDLILLFKASASGAITFTMLLFVTLLAPYILSYSSGVQIFLFRKTFQNVELFTFKSLMLGFYLFPSGIMYFILLDIIDAMLELYKWIAFGCINKIKSENELIVIESAVSEYFGMSRMAWLSFKKQKLMAQLFFETIPQVILQSLLAFGVIKGAGLNE
eukprot:215224_1